MNKSEFAASSALSEEERTTTIKLLKAMAPFYSIYYIDVRNLVVELELAVGEDMLRKMNFVLADPL